MTRLPRDMSGCPAQPNDPAIAAVENRRQLDAARRGVRNDPDPLALERADLEEFLR